MAKDKAKEQVAKVAAASQTEYDYVVITRFKDRNDHSKVYEVGTSVNKFGAERLEDLVSRKLVERRAK